MAPVQSYCAEVLCGWPQGLQNIQAESSYMTAPYLDHPSLTSTTVVHVVRNPLHVVNSFVSGFGYFSSAQPLWDKRHVGLVPCEYHEFIFRHVPELGAEMHQLTRACLYCVMWNRMIERKLKGRTYGFHCIEDGAATLLERLGLGGIAQVDGKIMNHCPGLRRTISVECFPETAVKSLFIEMAAAHGYDVGADR